MSALTLNTSTSEPHPAAAASSPLDVATPAGLEVTGVAVSFGGERVLHDIALQVSAGTTTAIVGPSGSGKTSLLRVIAGFLDPGSGAVMLRGADVTAVAPHRRSIGLVAQDGALFPHLDVAGNIAFGLPRGTRRRETRRRVEELLDLVSLDREHARRRPDQLSGGQRQRVALARALARRPDVILLDEPFSALDAGLRETTRQAVREILATTGTTTVLVTHDQDEALSFADQVAVLQEGRLSQIGSPESVYRRPRDTRTAQFLGESVLLPARTTGTGRATTALGEIRVISPDAAELTAPQNSPEVPDGQPGHGTVMLRPEQIELTEQGTPGIVVSSQYFGHDTTAVVAVEGLKELVRVRRLNADPLRAGAAVGLTVTGVGVLYPAASGGSGAADAPGIELLSPR
ncbi:ABC transporter ATP-binding protein [Nesterenkonia xinjiangensis]|uniref:ABC-type quaternary amine transporter n=1 Tax=Nesterenkonia xinjiangensis TaxID=225327 RepID=A0A7Z0KDJ2_9MICC|nr:ABC transporter ATP-binding protein [Nesterenkonia xinjiangensis]NYJ79687.1 iron(III) transport system ATP-binding protein [Nesterenkonia xinjiangensis]